MTWQWYIWYYIYVCYIILHIILYCIIYVYIMLYMILYMYICMHICVQYVCVYIHSYIHTYIVWTKMNIFHNCQGNMKNCFAIIYSCGVSEDWPWFHTVFIFFSPPVTRSQATYLERCTSGLTLQEILGRDLVNSEGWSTRYLVRGTMKPREMNGREMPE